MNPVLRRILTGISIGAVVIALIVFMPVAAVLPVVSVLALAAVVEFAQLLRRKVPRWTLGTCLGFLVGAAFIVGGLMALPAVAWKFGNLTLLFVVATVKFSDVGGFAFGLTSQRLMAGGNHKLCPTISPNKSWEGLLGSVVCSSLVACLFMSVTRFGVLGSVACGVVAALSGTAGDLVESKFKRWIGVKDSSTLAITNGLGGILDMFDSLLLAPAALYLILCLWTP